MTINILKTEPFQPLGPAIPKPAPAAPKAVEIKPGIWQAPDGKLRTDFATGQSVAPAPKVTIGVDLASGVDSTCITIYDLSKELGVKGSVVMLACMRFGQQVTLNQAIDGDLADLVRREIAPLFEVEEVPTPLPTLPVVPNSFGFKVGDRVKYNAENIAAMGDCERVIKRIQGDELYFLYPYGWDYADRMVPA